MNGTRNSNRSMDHVTRGPGSENNSMRFFVSRHLVPPPPPPSSSNTATSRPILDSLIWTTSGSTSAASPATTYGVSSNNNNNNSSPSSTSSNNTMMSQGNNSTAQPVINGSSKTRIDYHSMFIPGSSTNQRKMTSGSHRPVVGTSTGTQAGGHLLQAPRDRKPLSPEYEIPSVSSRASSSCGPFSDPHHQRMIQQQKQLASSHLNNQQESKCVNSSYNVNYGLQDEDRDLLGDEIIGHNPNQLVGQTLNVITTTNSDGSRVADLMMATPEAARSGSDLSRLSPSSNSMNHDVIMIGSDHESSPEHECKSNQSESHIYSHIYDPSSCSCPSCDRLTNTSSRTKIMYPTTSHTSHLCHDLTSSSVLRTGFGVGRHNQPMLTLPSSNYHDKLNKKKGKKGGNNRQTQQNISLATLHKLNSMKTSSPDFLSHHNLPPPYLQGLDHHLSHLNPYATTYNLPSISPIVIEYAKDRRKKCLVLSAALALLVLLILLLVTSFVVFIISSYQSYYSANAVAATFTGTSTALPPSFLDTSPSSSFNERGNTINNVSSFEDPYRASIPNHQTDPSTVSPSTTEPAQVSSTMAFNEPPNPVPVDQVPPVIMSHYDDEREEELNCREGEEWKCRDGLCVPKDKRCDGHFNCFDHSDEFDCDPCPMFDGYFHCGNNTSCLPPSKKCDGVYNCWDGADEHGCDSYVHDGYTTWIKEFQVCIKFLEQANGRKLWSFLSSVSRKEKSLIVERLEK